MRLPQPRPTTPTVDGLFVHALARRATAAERSLAIKQFGPTLDRTELADLLWSVVMLPEFQLVQ